MAPPASVMHPASCDAGFATAVETAERVGRVDQEVAELALRVGTALGTGPRVVGDARLVGLVHGFGKQAIPPALLAKADPLTPVEWAVIQRHTLIGQRILERVPYPGRAVAMLGAIRERWDGRGYPRGLAGEDIPLPARIVAVCVAYAAIRRGGRGRLPADHNAALGELDRSSGTQFDPAVVRAAIATLRPDDFG